MQSKFHHIWAAVSDGCAENVGSENGIVRCIDGLRKESYAAAGGVDALDDIVQQTYMISHFPADK